VKASLFLRPSPVLSQDSFLERKFASDAAEGERQQHGDKGGQCKFQEGAHLYVSNRQGRENHDKAVDNVHRGARQGARQVGARQGARQVGARQGPGTVSPGNGS
jgi:hypothetical protein